MRTMSQRVEKGSTHTTSRFAIWSPREAVVRAVSTGLRRFMPESWIVDLLVLAVALLFVGATAFYGLAVASKELSPSVPLITDHLTRGAQDRTDESGTTSVPPSGVWRSETKP